MPTRVKKILIAAPVKQDKMIFQEYLESMLRLKKPAGYEIGYFFILHDSDELVPMLSVLPGCSFEKYSDGSEYSIDGNTHEWRYENYKAVVNMKNAIIQKALAEGYDYWFQVDSDVILHSETLVHLLDQEKDLIATLYLTRWRKDNDQTGLNCWDYNEFYFHPGNEQRYLEKGIYRVGGTGAAMLFSRSALAAIKNMDPLYNVSFTVWEDRAWSIKAVAAGYEIFASSYYPAIHLYTTDHYKAFLEKKDQYIDSTEFVCFMGPVVAEGGETKGISNPPLNIFDLLRRLRFRLAR